MKNLLGLLKRELNENWRSQLDALGPVFGLRGVCTGKMQYYAMTCDKFELYVTREKILRDEHIRVEYSVFDEFEEKKLKVSTALFDRFVTALEDYARETEKERFLKRYRWEVMRRDDYTDDSDKKPGDMVEH